MPDFDALLTGPTDALTGTEVAISQGRIIARKPAAIAVSRRAGGGALPGAQTVRIDALRDPAKHVGDAASQSEQWVVVIGYRGHPDVADTDLKRGDRFAHNGAVFEVHQVDLANAYHFEAYCKAVK